jgi:hypothetical protein
MKDARGPSSGEHAMSASHAHRGWRALENLSPSARVADIGVKEEIEQPNLDSRIISSMRKQRETLNLLIAGSALVMLALPVCACATLGENSASSETDRVSMKASLRILPATQYTVHEIQTPSGTTVREYILPSGTVFAVGWRGPVMPDLRQALGSYFNRYMQAAGAQHAGHRHLAMSQPDLVVHSNGRMRAFSGRAYLPQLMPQGVTVDEIR